MIRARQSTPTPRQQGAALFIALIFLVILTLLSITAMRTSTLELYMATNEQEHRIGLDSTQSASVAVVKLGNANFSTTAPGNVTCIGFDYTPSATPDGGNCTFTRQMAAGSGISQNNFVQVTELYDGTCPPFMATGENATLGGSGGGSGGGSNCTYFTMSSEYDATAQRGARAAIVQGVVKRR